jgi:alpha-L-arabinofuranosidase
LGGGWAPHNTFQQPQAIQPAESTAAKLTADGFTATLPPKSVVVPEVK